MIHFIVTERYYLGPSKMTTELTEPAALDALAAKQHTLLSQHQDNVQVFTPFLA